MNRESTMREYAVMDGDTEGVTPQTKFPKSTWSFLRARLMAPRLFFFIFEAIF